MVWGKVRGHLEVMVPRNKIEGLPEPLQTLLAHRERRERVEGFGGFRFQVVGCIVSKSGPLEWSTEGGPLVTP